MFISVDCPFTFNIFGGGFIFYLKHDLHLQGPFQSCRYASSSSLNLILLQVDVQSLSCTFYMRVESLSEADGR